MSNYDKEYYVEALSAYEGFGIGIFGAGDCGIQLYQMLKILMINVDVFLDNNPQKWNNTVVGGIRCQNPNDFLDNEKLLIIVAIKDKQEAIAYDLKNLGFNNIILMNDIQNDLNSKIGAIIDDYGVNLVKYMSITRIGTDKCLEENCLPMQVHFYQPIPNLRDLERRNVWSKVSKLSGLVWEPDKYLCNLFELSNYKPAQGWARLKTSDSMEFNLDNNSFSYMCASALYGMIRLNKPKRIIEVGSGNSSKVIRKSLHDNIKEDSGYLACYTIIDPYCTFNEFQFNGINIKILKIPVEESNISLFMELEENDILFIDSSHTVKIGGDVNFEILEILPVLRKGVVIHFHDIHLPYEYARVYATNPDFRMFWTESYLLQAFLAFNSEYEILLPCAYLEGEHLPDIKSCYPDMCHPTDWSSGSFWIRKKL